MRADPGRRRVLLALAFLPLAACSPQRETWTPEPPTPPLADGGRVVLFLVPGLGLSDLLVASGEGALPNVALMRERGLLVEHLDSAPGVICTPGEVGREMLAWEYEAIAPPCPTWDLGLEGVMLEDCPPASSLDVAVTAWLDRLQVTGDRLQGIGDRVQGIGDGMRSVCPPSSPSRATGDAFPVTCNLSPVTCNLCPVVVALDGLLALQTGHLLADPRQPGYDEEAALRFAGAWLTALRGLDTALGRVLSRVDLSLWTVALASTCEVGAVHGALDPAQIRGSPRVLAGGAILETEGGVALPEGEAWSGVEAGRGPEPGGSAESSSAGVRLLAPPGYAFVPGDGTLPRAVPRPGGFMLAVGPGLSQGVRLGAMLPASVGKLLWGLTDDSHRDSGGPEVSRHGAVGGGSMDEFGEASDYAG
ncbi:MAG: hypothetical protein HPY83_01995 [Anaerolineae bacterium]|nr:hypothetical protein [Anaerolineae bacterium]